MARYLRGSAYMVTFVGLTVVGVIPVMMYYGARAPSEEEKARRADLMRPRGLEETSRSKAFRDVWKKRQEGDDGLEESMNEMLRGGTSRSVRQGHNYTGKLGDAEESKKEAERAHRMGLKIQNKKNS